MSTATTSIYASADERDEIHQTLTNVFMRAQSAVIPYDNGEYQATLLMRGLTNPKDHQVSRAQNQAENVLKKIKAADRLRAKLEAKRKATQ